jgi:hypothetical protein
LERLVEEWEAGRPAVHNESGPNRKMWYTVLVRTTHRIL